MVKWVVSRYGFEPYEFKSCDELNSYIEKDLGEKDKMVLYFSNNARKHEDEQIFNPLEADQGSEAFINAKSLVSKFYHITNSMRANSFRGIFAKAFGLTSCGIAKASAAGSEGLLLF